MTDHADDPSTAFLHDHRWAVLATSRRDGSPQQSMIGYAVDADGRVVISVKSYTAKWRNVLRQPRVSLTVVDGHSHLVVYGEAETIEHDPERAERTAMVFARLNDAEPPDPASIVELLDEQQRTVLRITPDRILFLG